MAAILPLVTLVSAILAIAASLAASLAGPAFIIGVYVFKPLTTLLVVVKAGSVRVANDDPRP